MGKKEKEVTKVVIILDTSTLHSNSAYYLLSEAIYNLIGKYPSLSKTRVSRRIPEVVIKERLFQMNKAGEELLPNKDATEKMEEIIGKSINVSKNIFKKRINKAVEKQIIDCGLKLIRLNPKKVNRHDLINKAAYRLAPFEYVKKSEKGFRDAVILECFKQKIQEAKSKKDLYKIVIIAHDELLRETVKNETIKTKNIYIYKDITELEGFMKVIYDQEIEETLIKPIATQVGKIFFSEEEKSIGLYYERKISETIKNRFGSELNKVPPGAHKRENRIWFVGNPSFEKKIDQKIYWKTIIEVEFIKYKISYTTTPTQVLTMGEFMTNTNNTNTQRGNFITTEPATIGTSTSFLDSSRVILDQSSIGSYFADGNYIGGLATNSNPSINTYFDTTRVPTQEEIGKGRSRFEIKRSTLFSLSKNNNITLKNHNLEEINYIDTITD